MLNPEDDLFEYSPQVTEYRYFTCKSSKPQIPFKYAGGYEHCSPDYEVTRPYFPHWIVEIIISGEGKLNLAGTAHPIKAGSIFSYGPNINHSISSSKEHPLIKYFFTTGYQEFPRTWMASSLLPGKFTQLNSVAKITHWCDLILQEGMSESKFSEQNVEDLISILLRKIGQLKTQDRPFRKRNAVLTQAISLITEESKTLHTVNELSQKLKVSPEYLCRIFKKDLGLSPYQMLMSHKMNEAFHLLKQGGMKVNEVSQVLNFNDPFHFSKCFRRYYGYPPSKLI